MKAEAREARKEAKKVAKAKRDKKQRWVKKAKIRGALSVCV